MVATTGYISTIAGTGTAGSTGDGGQANLAKLSAPSGVAFDASGNIYIADAGNNKIRKITTAGVISTFAGNGTAGSTGDGGQASSAELSNPLAVAFDASGNLYIADNGNNKVRKITTAGVISTFAGGGTGGLTVIATGTAQATAVTLNQVNGVVADPSGSGNVYFTLGADSYVCKVNTSGVISFYAGDGGMNGNNDGGQATASGINDPQGLACDASGNLYIADNDNNAIRKVTASTGVINRIVGNWTAGFSGDGGAPLSAELQNPWGVAVDASGNVYIADAVNNRIREVSSLCPANAGENGTVVNPGDCCGGTPFAIGTPSVTNMSYSWSPANSDLSSYTIAQPTSTWSNTSSCEIYTLSVSYSLCTTNTSTVKVCARAFSGSSCCRLASTTTDGFGIALPANFSVYPNPSNSSIIIGLYDVADYVRIIDMQARTVYEAQNTDAGELKLDISNYKKGIYFVMAKIGNTIEKQKLIVE
jgi:sugar lactone lactonase YvrE